MGQAGLRLFCWRVELGEDLRKIASAISSKSALENLTDRESGFKRAGVHARSIPDYYAYEVIFAVATDIMGGALWDGVKLVFHLLKNRIKKETVKPIAIHTTKHLSLGKPPIIFSFPIDQSEEDLERGIAELPEVRRGIISVLEIVDTDGLETCAIFWKRRWHIKIP